MRNLTIQGNTKFIVYPSKSKKTGLVVNTLTGKSYVKSLKNVKLVRSSVKTMSTVALTVLNKEKKTASAGMKARIKGMLSKITFVSPKLDKKLQW